MPTAFITGINGQDGSYLAEFLLSKNYRVVGMMRNKSANLDLINHILDSIEIVEADLGDEASLGNALARSRPDEVYNLAARASGSELWANPALTGEVNGLLVTRLMEVIRKIKPDIRVCQASSSEVFGDPLEAPQDESTPLRPRNPYGAAKTYGHWITVNYRQSRGLFACSAILFNHESPRRRLEFVTRKISHTVARIKFGLAKELRLGNLDASRDWGFAAEYVQAMWLMLQRPEPDDFVIASGTSHSVREFCKLAFSHVGLDYRDYVVADQETFRVSENTPIVGNAAKAKRVLGWAPQMTFEDLVRIMVDADLARLQKAPLEMVSSSSTSRTTHARESAAPRKLGEV
jgi:GDPmannose 4,6-dehydratase